VPTEFLSVIYKKFSFIMFIPHYSPKLYHIIY
jgi:hypothetical protein